MYIDSVDASTYLYLTNNVHDPFWKDKNLYRGMFISNTKDENRYYFRLIFSICI